MWLLGRRNHDVFIWNDTLRLLNHGASITVALVDRQYLQVAAYTRHQKMKDVSTFTVDPG